MDVKIIKLITTRHDYTIEPMSEETIRGIVDVHEDITELVDLYHERWRKVWDSEDTPEHYKNMCEQTIDTEVVKLSTVQELITS